MATLDACTQIKERLDKVRAHASRVFVATRHLIEVQVATAMPVGATFKEVRFLSPFSFFCS
jgi:hypothetical protein